VIEMYLMIKYARLGPSSLHTGQYHHEKLAAEAAPKSTLAPQEGNS